MVIPSRNPWGIHHPHRQPARRKEKWEGGRANGGAKWEAIGGRQRENVCFCACLHACPPVFCVCAEIWGIYGSRVEMRRRVVCVCVWECERGERIISELSGFSREQPRTKGSVSVQEAQRMADAAIWGVFWLQLGYQLLSPIHTPTHTHRFSRITVRLP